MAKVKKKKLKLKKKNFIIFLIIIFAITFTITKTITSIINSFDQDNNEEKVTITKKQLTKKEKKLQKLNNIDKEIEYFNYNNIDRYIKYKNKNKNLNLKKVITDVNIGLDYPYYENTKRAKNLNRSYILVNKYNYLPNNYVPKNLETIDLDYARSGMKLVNYAKEAFENMAKDAKKENYRIIAMSSYRSYDYQTILYDSYVEEDGKEKADTYSGRPGFSEHQTGLAIDIYNGKENYTNFEKTKEFKWMQKHAHEYGFILRFPKDKEKETGYKYESWHYRYVGKNIATYIHKNKISYEEYYVQNIEQKK